ncbi:MAG: hypothetical protein WD556_07715 [Actinomycetota bacterium]
MTELAYESVRQQQAPEFPSRLNSLFAFLDPFEALDLTRETAKAYMVIRGTVPAGVRFGVVDMMRFNVVELGTSEEEVVSAYRAAEADAAKYWGEDDMYLPEVLADGHVLLGPHQVSLVLLLQDLGLLADRPPRSADERP